MVKIMTQIAESRRENDVCKRKRGVFRVRRRSTMNNKAAVDCRCGLINSREAAESADICAGLRWPKRKVKLARSDLLFLLFLSAELC